MIDLDDDEQEPLFESVEAMCRAFGWDLETQRRIEREMTMTAPREDGETLH